MVRQPIHQVIPQQAGQPFLELLRRVYETGEAYHHHEARGHVVVDGHWQESWFSFSCNSLYAPDGTIFGLINTATDVTGQVVALRESEQRYRLLSEELEHQVAERTRELAEANENLKRSNENLQQFAYVTSHDLQEPLRKIQQFGDLLKTQYAEPLGQGVSRANAIGRRPDVPDQPGLADLLPHLDLSAGNNGSIVGQHSGADADRSGGNRE